MGMNEVAGTDRLTGIVPQQLSQSHHHIRPAEYKPSRQWLFHCQVTICCTSHFFSRRLNVTLILHSKSAYLVKTIRIRWYRLGAIVPVSRAALSTVEMTEIIPFGAEKISTYCSERRNGDASIQWWCGLERAHGDVVSTLLPGRVYLKMLTAHWW